MSTSVPLRRPCSHLTYCRPTSSLPACGKAHVIDVRNRIESGLLARSFAGLVSLLDNLLDGHVYTVEGCVKIDQKLLVLAQAPASNKLADFRTSSSELGSECLFSDSEGQTQARQRFCNGSVRRRRAPKFTGARRYVVQTFVHDSELNSTLRPTLPSAGLS